MKPMVVAAMAMLISTAALAGPPKRDCGALPDGSLIGEAHAIDGDTLAMMRADDTRTPNIRLWGIQAPELRDAISKVETAAGMRARAALEAIAGDAGQSVTCRPIEWDSYCRVVARCAVDGTPDINLAMLSSGDAYLFTTYALTSKVPADVRAKYIAAERQARSDRRGLWRTWLVQ